MKKMRPDFLPRIIITNDVPSTLAMLQKDDPDILVLYLLNKERFLQLMPLTYFKLFLIWKNTLTGEAIPL